MSDYELQTDAVEGCIPIIASVHRHEDSYDGNCDSQEYINQYKVIETIGCGSFGQVQLCEVASSPERSNEYAVKMIDRKRASRMRWLKSQSSNEESIHYTKSSVLCESRPESDAARSCVPSARMVYRSALDMVYDEIFVLKKLMNHKNIVKLFEVLDDPSDFAVCLVFEYLSEGPIMTFNKEAKMFIWGKCMLREANIQQAMLRYSQDLFNGISYMHSRGVCHRDIKPENLLIGGDRVLRIIDFGCATSFIDDNPSSSNCRCGAESSRTAALDSPAARCGCDARCNACRGLVVDTVGTPVFWGPECIPSEDIHDDELGFDIDDDNNMPPIMPTMMSSPLAPPSAPAMPRKHYFSAFTMDCWAAGMTLYCLLYQRLPIAQFIEDNAIEGALDIFSFNAKLFQEISKMEDHDSLWLGEDLHREDIILINSHRAAVVDVARHLLVADPRARWTAARTVDHLVRVEETIAHEL